MSNTRERAVEIKAEILKAFGPPSAGKRLTKAAIEAATGLPRGEVIHHVWVLTHREAKLQIVDKVRGEGSRGRAADVYTRIAGNGAGEAA